MTVRSDPVLAPRSTVPELSVLSLVPDPHATFYRDRLEALSELGVATTVVPVSGTDGATDPSETRSVTDYLRQAADVARRPLEEFDLVHANYGLTGPAALVGSDLPVVLSLWGSDLFGRYGPVTRLAARRADAVVVMSDGMAESLDRDCEVIPHGVDMELFRPQPRDEALAAAGWDPAARHVFFPYSPDRAVKNYPLAERAAEAADRRLHAPVEFHAADEWIPHWEMAVYMSAADVMALPSEHEGSPNTVKEAMACNLPVVATDVGDVAERLEGVEPSAAGGSESAFVDALTEVLRRPERSDGRAHVGELRVERTARDVLEVYRDVLDRR